ncbi:MAG TPA: hypothetical protein VJ757_15655 [Pseudonocardiaceae bacterium]|nr:hypothetical protein [Pseudonocardiaceae bacterium]
MSLLDGPDWHGQIFTGVWQHSAGGDSAVMEPATGTELGRRHAGLRPSSRFGGAAANIDAFTEIRWITARGAIPTFPI